MIDLTPASDEMIALLDRITEDQLTSPTPCDEGSVRFAGVARHDADPAIGPGAGDLRPGWRLTVAQNMRALATEWGEPAAWQGSSVVGGLELSNELWGRIALTGLWCMGGTAPGRRVSRCAYRKRPWNWVGDVGGDTFRVFS